MAETRTNYVVACWMGERRSEHGPNTTDRTSFLRAHIHALETLPHSLDQVTVVLAEGGDPKADTFAKSLTEISGVPVEVLVRPNVGMSYAGWNLAHETFGDEFTHFVIVEDDYVPFLANFDALLVDLTERYKTYVCGLTGEGQIAAISNGAIPEQIWRRIRFPPLGNLGATPSLIEIQKANYRCQSNWSRSFPAGGYLIQEYLEQCSSPFWFARLIRWYGHPSLPPLFIPVQAIGHYVPVTGGAHHATVMFENGAIVPASEADAEIWAALKATPRDDPCWRGRFTPLRR